MPDEAPSALEGDRIPALLIVCALALASIVIALVGTTPSRVGASELMGAARTPGDRAFIASHRGGGATAPENTLPAIAAALAGGFDYVEVDVALTADRHPVLLHDATVDRTTDGSGPLAQLTLDEVRALDAGSWFDERFAGTRVPTLDELLDLLTTTGGRAMIELKGKWDAASVAGLVSDVSTRGLDRRVIVSSFDARTLALLREASAVIPILAILKESPDDVVAAVEETGASGIVVDRRAVLAHPGIVDELHAAGKRVVVYTLNTDRQWGQVTSLGVDGIVTDDPGTLSQWQESAASTR